MSHGRRIDDHSFWAGKKGKDSVFPDGPHRCKEESSAEGVGMVEQYEDTTEGIRRVQEMQKQKVNSNKMKPGHRQ